MEKTDAKKHCWTVECKQICIPRIVLPWQKRHSLPCMGNGCCDTCTGGGCCDDGCRTVCLSHNGARVRTVRVLKKHSYTCPQCKYTWTPRECCHAGACGDGCCTEDGCTGGIDGEEAPGIEEVPEPAPELAAPLLPAGSKVLMQRRPSPIEAACNQFVKPPVPSPENATGRYVRQPTSTQTVRKTAFVGPRLSTQERTDFGPHFK